MSIKIVLIGASGYAGTYIEWLLENKDKGSYRFAGIVDIDFSSSPYYQQLLNNKIPMFNSLESYLEGNTADLVIVSVPTHFHKYYSILAVQNGANVLCEKPVAPLYRDALEMLEASRKTGKFIAIGFQWSYSKAILSLKHDILSGAFGAPKLLKTFVSWPRNWDYYKRGIGWAGKIKDKNGNMILDSVVSNATAHYLHNMYFVLGDKINAGTMPKTIQSELYRANDIENFDTCLLDIYTKNDVRLFYVASHATDKKKGPVLQYQFENGLVTYGENTENIVAQFSNGEIKDYGDPFQDTMQTLIDCIESINSGKELSCTVETALPHTYTIDKLYHEGQIYHFPASRIRHDEEKRATTVNGLFEELEQAFKNNTGLGKIVE